MRVVIVGGSHAGIAAARHLKKIAPAVEVMLIERTNVLGFIGNSLNLYLEGFIENLAAAKTVKPSQLLAEQINVLMNTEVTAIDRKAKKVDFVIQAKNEQIQDSVHYDYLILATGSSQYQTDFSHKTQAEITHYKTFSQAKAAFEKISAAKKLAIIGAGLIGFELVESLAHSDKEIYLIEQMDSVLFRYFDQEITQKLLKKMPENVHLLLNTEVKDLQLDEKGRIQGLQLSNEENLACDSVVYAINPRPNISLFAADLAMNPDGTIACNDYLQTADQAIYAVGDLVAVHFNIDCVPLYIPLVSNAYRTGIIAASNILLKEKIPLPKSQRTIVSELFNSYLASTGVNEVEAPYYGLKTQAVVKSYQNEGFFDQTDDFELTLKIVFDEDSKRLLGGQLMTNSRSQVELVNTLSALITMGADLYQLSTMDFYFNPKLSLPLNFLNDLALEGIIK